jgi:hypothetical protein
MRIQPQREHFLFSFLISQSLADAALRGNYTEPEPNKPTGLVPLRYALCYYGNLAQSASAKDSLGIILISTPENAKNVSRQQRERDSVWGHLLPR